MTEEPDTGKQSAVPWITSGKPRQYMCARSRVLELGLIDHGSGRKEEKSDPAGNGAVERGGVRGSFGSPVGKGDTGFIFAPPPQRSQARVSTDWTITEGATERRRGETSS